MDRQAMHSSLHVGADWLPVFAFAEPGKFGRRQDAYCGAIRGEDPDSPSIAAGLRQADATVAIWHLRVLSRGCVKPSSPFPPCASCHDANGPVNALLAASSLRCSAPGKRLPSNDRLLVSGMKLQNEPCMALLLTDATAHSCPRGDWTRIPGMRSWPDDSPASSRLRLLRAQAQSLRLLEGRKRP
ncbi:hypothetical protein SVAN01_00235 [Stagonosporopsis vannaccii]|nr:hypothetical protein SVAN01_00235 [Stagonosporopsis vannaccii]